MSTTYDRTAIVPFENRVVTILSGITTTADRTVEVPKERRTVYVERQLNQYDRTVYVTE